MAKKTSVGLRIIAIGKLFKVCALVVFGVLALTMASGGDPPEAFRHWMNALQIDAGGRIIHGVLSKITGVDSKKLAELGVGSFVYAALFAVEGVGLWLQKRWAEWFTIAITISFIPIEMHEILKHVNAPKIIVLVLNVAALVYLGFRVRQEHKLGARINRLVEQVVRT